MFMCQVFLDSTEQRTVVYTCSLKETSSICELFLDSTEHRIQVQLSRQKAHLIIIMASPLTIAHTTEERWCAQITHDASSPSGDLLFTHQRFQSLCVRVWGLLQTEWEPFYSSGAAGAGVGWGLSRHTESSAVPPSSGRTGVPPG